jgi:ribosomal protein S18 acetylase RimI-like enzyme
MKSHKLDFVQITSKNVGQVRLLNSKCFPIQYKEAFYEQLIANSEFVKLGYYADCLVGTVGCKIESKRLYIMTLGVLQNYRRYGFGSQLLDWVIETARREELAEIVLHVQTSNEAAICFYKNLGFHIERTEDDYYPQLVPSSALYLVKRL